VIAQAGVFGTKRHASIRNNLAVALFDNGYLDKAQAQLDCVAVIERDARILNNLIGVLKIMQRKIDEAAQCFESALAIEADHALATFNASTLKSPRVRGKLDRTGAAGAMDDTRSKALLENVVRFAPEQILEVHINGKWTMYHVGSQAFQDQFSVNPLPLFHYRPVGRSIIARQQQEQEQEMEMKTFIMEILQEQRTTTTTRRSVNRKKAYMRSVTRFGIHPTSSSSFLR
jgi:hypothetical protein